LLYCFIIIIIIIIIITTTTTTTTRLQIRMSSYYYLWTGCWTEQTYLTLKLCACVRVGAPSRVCVFTGSSGSVTLCLY